MIMSCSIRSTKSVIRVIFLVCCRRRRVVAYSPNATTLAGLSESGEMIVRYRATSKRMPPIFVTPRVSH